MLLIFGLVQDEGLVLGGVDGINVCGRSASLASSARRHYRDDPRRFGTRYQSKLFNLDSCKRATADRRRGWSRSRHDGAVISRRRLLRLRGSARAIAGDARGIWLDRTVTFTDGRWSEPGDTGGLRLSAGRAIAIVDTVKGDGPDKVIHVPCIGSDSPAPGYRAFAELDWERVPADADADVLAFACSVIPGAVTGAAFPHGWRTADLRCSRSGLDKEAIAMRLNARIAEADPVGPSGFPTRGSAAEARACSNDVRQAAERHGGGVDGDSRHRSAPCAARMSATPPNNGRVAVDQIENKGKNRICCVILAFAE